ncbi:MAG TPA: cupin domain-containing protein [Candidatus Faecicola pullistercoris]|nr:cupin domain-containing protein [Candidatus Faecicola pullistercoris]
MKNLFEFPRADYEVSELVLSRANVRIEKIFSPGNDTPFMTQDEDEWVSVLKGAGVLEFQDGSSVSLNEGDCLLIEKGTLHRVKQTADSTVWLCVFIK